RGVLEPHHLAALPRRRPARAVPPRLVGLLRGGEPPVRRRRDRRGRTRRDRLGARLPPAAGAEDDPRPAARPADRLLPPHPVPAAGAVRADPLAAPDPRGDAGRPGGGLPDRG